MSTTNTAAKEHKPLAPIRLNWDQAKSTSLFHVFKKMAESGAIIAQVIVTNEDGSEVQALSVCVRGKEESDEVSMYMDQLEKIWLGQDPDEDQAIPAFFRSQVIELSKKVKHSGKRGHLWYNPEKSRAIWVASPQDTAPNHTTRDQIEAMFMKMEGIEDFQILTDESPDEDSGYERIYPPAG